MNLAMTKIFKIRRITALRRRISPVRDSGWRFLRGSRHPDIYLSAHKVPGVGTAICFRMNASSHVEEQKKELSFLKNRGSQKKLPVLDTSESSLGKFE